MVDQLSMWQNNSLFLSMEPLKHDKNRFKSKVKRMYDNN